MYKFYVKAILSSVLLTGGFANTFAQSAKSKAEIKKISKSQKLLEFEKKLKEKNKIEKKIAIQTANMKGWPIKGKLKNGAYFELMRIAADGSPVYYQTYNADASKSTRANTLNSGGVLGLDLNGEGMTVHIWDGGHALTTHQEYDGDGGYNRVSIGDSPLSTNYHAGHVIGTILASGYKADAKGMAPQAYGVSYEWTDDSAEASEEAANGMILSNHSYGYRSDLVNDQYFGAYISESRVWDQIMYDAPYYLMVVAAGNDGGNDDYNESPLDGYSAYDKLTGHSTSKNNLVVANASDASVDSQGDLISVSRHWSSSEGPTDDYRIKPDITGNGVDVYSSGVDNYYSYETLTGTSMASPSVTGTLALLQQHYENLNGSVMKAASLKGLALHTADDISPNGPDAQTGWGLINAKKAAQVISQVDDKSMLKELSLSNGQTYTTTVNASGNEDLIVSISWTDPAGQANTATNSSLAALVNDLDVRVKKNTTTYYPWKLTGVTTNGRGDNSVDPYERIDIDNASGSYTITVTNKGSLSGDVQDFTLIASGISGAVSDTEAPTTPTDLTVVSTTSSSVSLDWSNATDNVAVAGYKIYVDGELYKSVTQSEGLITGLEPSTTYSIKVLAYDAEGNQSSFSSSVSATTKEGSTLNYCSSVSEDATNEHISGVSFGEMNNSSDNTTYSDFTNLYTDVEKGKTYELKVSKAWVGTLYSVAVRAWIDFNNDGDFDDAGEMVMDKSADKTSTVSTNVTIPQDAVSTITRMRVIAKFSSGASACGSYNYGETEDYSVNILGEPTNGSDTEAPTMPTNLEVTGTTSNSVSLSWNASTDNVGVTGYNLYQDGSLIKNVNGTSTTVNNLTENTNYTFSVSAIDAAGNESGKSISVSVTTDTDSTPTPVEYCSLSATNSSYEWIDYIAIGDMANSSANDGGYGDYTNKVANIGYGDNAMDVSAGYKSSIYTENWYVWVDLNQDGTFSSTELLLSGETNGDGIFNGTLSIPYDALSGKTRMRVAMKYSADSSACGTFTYGEVEDYTVNIGDSSYGYSVQNFNTEPMQAINTNKKKVEVYPNPVKKSNKFTITSKEIKDGSFEIFDNNGNLVEFGLFTKGKIDLNIYLSSGKYVVRVSNDGRNDTAHFIVK